MSSFHTFLLMRALVEESMFQEEVRWDFSEFLVASNTYNKAHSYSKCFLVGLEYLALNHIYYITTGHNAKNNNIDNIKQNM